MTSQSKISAFSNEFYEMLESESRTSSLQERLQEQGYTGGADTIPILSDGMRQMLIQTLPDLFAGKFETNIYPDEWHWRAGISRPDATREMCNAWKSSRTIASIVLSEQLGKFVANLMGWDSVRIAQDDIVWKPPQPTPKTQLDYIPQRRIDTVGFHQDSAYISKQFTPYDNNSVTVWIALDDADEENGCLEYGAGSHLWRPILHMTNDTGELSADMAAFHGSDETSYKSTMDVAHVAATNCTPQTKDIRAAPVTAGHAVIHHQDAWHGSGPNTSERHRRALVAHYIRGDVSFVDEPAGGLAPFGTTSYIYGRYRRFRSNELDETYFPIVYSDEQNSELKRTEWLDHYVTFS